MTSTWATSTVGMCSYAIPTSQKDIVGILFVAFQDGVLLNHQLKAARN